MSHIPSNAAPTIRRERPLIPALSAISSIQADDTTLTITLDQPDSEFLSYLTLAILPEDYTDQATAPVGHGAFQIRLPDSPGLHRSGAV